MQKPEFRPINPAGPAADAAGSGKRPAKNYRPAFERLWWESGPAVLTALDKSGHLIPQNIAMRLCDWTEQVMPEDPVAALALAALDRAFRDLSTFRLACYSYRLGVGVAHSPFANRVVMADRGYALAIGRAQVCVAQLAGALHDQAGERTILAAVGREREVLWQIFNMMEGLR